MLSWTLAFLIIAVLAALLGFAGIVGTVAGVAKVVSAIFLALFIASLFLGRGMTGPSQRRGENDEHEDRHHSHSWFRRRNHKSHKEKFGH
jgi:uncharacterized membrane protein YtjA (UPF0391 family)